MRYAGLIKNDFSAAHGTCVTFFTQGCPHKCPGCHNPETWDFSGGQEFTTDVLQEIYDAISANDIQRNFCIMGGEPLCPENQFLTYLVISQVKDHYPDINITIWTGYTLDELLELPTNGKLKQILESINCLVDGRYIQEEKDITLPMRGSRNQRILYKNIDF